MSASSSLSAAALRGQYVIEGELGRGGMATVYLAHDLKHDRRVALKVLRPEVAALLGSERFQREIRLAARLQHPHILPVHDSGEADGQFWFTMPYVDGESLRDRLRREGRLPLADVLRITHQVGDALDYAHRAGVVHRDVKPGNILLTPDGHALVADFGLARASDGGEEPITDHGLAVGTPAYMSPEQAMGGFDVDGRSDVYSLGCVVYEMITGERPYAGSLAATPPSATPPSATPPSATPPSAAAPSATSGGPRLAPVPAAIEPALRTALARSPADRFATATEFADALARAVGDSGAFAARARWDRGPFSRRRLAIGLGLLVAALATLLWLRPGLRPVELDPDRLAVGPFDVLDPRLQLWREGLVDVLSRNFDGAGRLHTVPPTLVLRQWRGRVDPASARELGRRTGAGLVVFGQILGSGGDSVRLRATLLDVKAGKALADVDRIEHVERIDRLADAVTVDFLRDLGASGNGTTARLGSVGTRSLPALRAFLQGEQFYRRTAWDSALGSYQRAVELDSGFASAWRRMSRIIGWQRIGGDSLSRLYGLRAGALNRGLGPRDSLLIVADSLYGAVFSGPADADWREHQARLQTTLDQAARRYPDDSEVWYQVGESRLHLPLLGHGTREATLAAFDRAIELDSTLGPAYFHPVELAAWLGRPASARRYLAAYLALRPTDVTASGARLAARLLAGPGGSSAGPEGRGDSAPAAALYAALRVVRYWPDSVETEVELARALLASPPSGYPFLDDTVWFRPRMLARALAHRGHLREAFAIAAQRVPVAAIPAIALGGVPHPAAAAALARWLDHVPPLQTDVEVNVGLDVPLFAALPYWAGQRDTGALRAFARREEARIEAAAPSLELRLLARYGAAAAQAYLALARADTAEALRRFAALPDTVCVCALDRITTARLLAARGRVQDAAARLERAWPPFWSPVDGLWELERARLAERLGRTREAADAYRAVIALWGRADAPLQLSVTEARAGLRRLDGMRSAR